MNKNSRRMVLVLLLTVAAAGLYYYFSNRPAAVTSAQGGRRGADGGRPMPVLAAAARRGDIDVVINALGTVTARNTVVIKARVDGQLVRVSFVEGQLVKAGALLAEIDPRPFRVLLDQANGQLVHDRALLANAQLDLERYRGLLAKESIARQQLDTQAALVQQYQGTVQTDQAQVDSARLQLDFTRITAPVAGRLGLRQVDVGNMVHAGDATGLVVLTQTQPIMVVFALPAEGIGAVTAHQRAGETLPVEAWDRDGKTRLASGKLLAIDNQIDTTTGTVRIKAEFTNADNALFPNQFVNTRLRVETLSDATLVPVAAIQRGSQGTFVYVVNSADNTVSLRPVTLGTATADTVSIATGLEPGEQVVVDGADKLRPGAKVEVATPESRQSNKRNSLDGAPRGDAGRHRGGNPDRASGTGAGNAGRKDRP
ncbi:MAG: MdtA/MuxA family multidrug efflux RND transporter periplasmic adaptor subunit [Pseudomonadota bacterium]